MALQSFALSKTELDAYQVLVLDKKIDRPMIVTGCAGSGKSVLAIHKAKELRDQGYSFLFIVFTQALGSYMKAGINQLGLDINSFSTYGKCFRKNSEDEWVWGKGDYDFIIVDEAQDFSLEALKVLDQHCRHLYVFGDSAQSLYKEFLFDHNKTLKMEDVERFLNQRMDDLILNHRLPESIAKVAQWLNTEDDRLVGRCVKKGGKKPKIIEYPNFEEQCKAVKDIIENMNFEDVGILCYHREIVKSVGEYFSQHKRNIDVYLDNKANIKFDSGNPKVMTFKSSKGLQFQTVFMLCCDTSIDDFPSDAYVAMTRSYQDLYIFYSGTRSNLFQPIPEDLYDTSLNGSAPTRRF